jgi:hypothetical protein
MRQGHYRQFIVPHNWTMKVVKYTQYTPAWVHSILNSSQAHIGLAEGGLKR